jgi:hypothetical protein
MLGVDDVALLLVATFVANLMVEVGAELVAEWVVYEYAQRSEAASSAVDQFGNSVEITCIQPTDTAFIQLVGNAPLAEQCVTMLRLVVN